jgi:hypothetical protein
LAFSHLKLGQLRAMMSLDVPAGLAAQRFLEGFVDALAADPDYPRDVGRRNAAQFERHDLLLAVGGIDLRGWRTSVTAIVHFGN